MKPRTKKHSQVKKLDKQRKKKKRAHHRRAYSVAETGELLAMSVSTVRRMIKDGRLRAVRTCGTSRGRIIISEAAINEYLGDSRKDVHPPRSQDG